MPADKTARMITKLTESLREKDAEITRLARLVDAAITVATRAEELEPRLRRRLAAAEARCAELDMLNAGATAKIDELEIRCEAQKWALRSSENMRLAAVAERDAVAATLEELGPQIILVEAQRAALGRILDGVRDRMRRKELEEESAVLNRKAIVGAKPERNFR